LTNQSSDEKVDQTKKERNFGYTDHDENVQEEADWTERQCLVIVISTFSTLSNDDRTKSFFIETITYVLSIVIVNIVSGNVLSKAYYIKRIR
jgi:hypothetical protein